MSIKFLLLLFAIPLFSRAQTYSYKNPTLLEIHYSVNDFRSGRAFGNYTGMDAGIGVSFIKGINKRFDYSIQVDASFPDSVRKILQTSKNNTLLIESAALLRARIFAQQRALQPYLFAGVGGRHFQDNTGVFIPFGLGLQYNYKDVYLLLNASYRKSVSDAVNSSFFYSIGIAGVISKPKGKKKLETSPVVQKMVYSDRDGDGIVDSLDACPTTPGLSIFKGCPDSDGDGIMDSEDKCPTRAGTKKYNGCPVPDSDGDGIDDEKDSCVTVPGFLLYHGCPVPDRDKDGVSDEEDACIDVFGLKTNKGCPEVKKELSDEIAKAAQNIFFETGSYKLLAKSYPALNKVVELLQANEDLNLLIEGHTDNQGTEEMNQKLSEDRARSVFEYLITRGVNEKRLSAIGYGMGKPLADNDTEEHKAMNRRVVLKLHYR